MVNCETLDKIVKIKILETALFQGFLVAGAEGLEPSARGFGDRCSTN